MKRNFLLITFSILVYSSQIFAQTISSVAWIPQNPTSSDNIKLIVTNSFTSSDCSLQSELILPGTTLSVTGYYCTGVLGALCSSTDTFDIGQFGNGSHNVRFQLSIPSGGLCDSIGGGYSIVDANTVTINVGPVSNTPLLNDVTPSVNAFPTPSIATPNFKYANLKGEYNSLVIFTLEGKMISKIKLEGKEGTIKLEEELLPGSYFYRLNAENTKSVSQKFVILE